MGTMVGGLVVLVNSVTITAALGGLPGWLDAVLIATALGITAVVAHRAWTRERQAGTEIRAGHPPTATR